MLAKTGLLIVSNPKQIEKVLSCIHKQVKSTLYIQLLSALSEPFGSFHTNIFTSWPKYSQTIFGIYSQAATHCKNLDVRVLLSGLKYNLTQIQTKNPIDLVIFDKSHSQADIDNFIKTKIENITTEYNVLTLDSGKFVSLNENRENHNEKVCKHTVLGGTFDRLHLAHKLLLSEAALRSSSKVTIGVTEENMLQGKTLWELIEDIDVRVQNIKDFLLDVCPQLEYDVVPISDPFGPAIVDPTMELIVVSDETLRGGQKINEIRKSKNLSPLEIVQIELVDEPNPNPIEESKISSSTARIRLLGSLLKPVQPNPNLSNKPYVIGLTGGIASGKSGVAQRLSELGALLIDCDKVAHELYKPGKPCYKLVVEHFGESVVAENGEIDRKVLGGIVFRDPSQLTKLNNIVWPAIGHEVNNIIKTTNHKVVVVEAAVLLSAGWEHFCHEVWTTLVPRQEAIERLKRRNNLTEEQASARISSQPPNSTYVKAAHVAFCTLWPAEYTKEQVVKAWTLLQERLL